MQATTVQFVAAIASSVAAVFAALTWWRGRHQAAPDLRLAVEGWHVFRGHDGEPDGYGTVNNSLYGTLTNVGNAPAHALRIEIDGGTAYVDGTYPGRLPNPVPMLGDGDTLTFVIGMNGPVDGARVSITWGQPPNAARRRGPKRWDLTSFAPEGWSLDA
ncbi:hypothetical protein [Actinomycetospora flava]|uniref:Uncharacterized protein n=1 Tax=Actinomycetospora flava TaxID=3129232 RepID=A0ABU8M1R7_9PSEU